MTVPPNMLACMGIAFGAWLAARTGRRAPLIIGSAVIAILGMYYMTQVVSSKLLTGYVVLITTKTRASSLRQRAHIDLSSKLKTIQLERNTWVSTLPR